MTRENTEVNIEPNVTDHPETNHSQTNHSQTNHPEPIAPKHLAIGQIVQVRSRRYLVEEVSPPAAPGGDHLVRLACLDDDAQGQILEVFWERELDAQMLGASSWESVAQRGFDDPRYFSAYFHALQWNRVTATDPKLFQAPYRAGIEVKAYQLEPLRKALQMPRVALFIADDVGLGKTIEAGLILRELLLRQKIRRVVIACPPSVVRQWQAEMESRFGLLFQVFDRDFLARKRRERGYGVNPWKTHTRFIISHALLRDETYAAPLRDWLGEFCPGSMLILDEAHNAAPASASRYAIDSHLTRTVRGLADRFEHKLFLSATPHNGHSNSFAALLEMLDPQRFCRGVPVRDRTLLDQVMVRRLKQDLREIQITDFPERLILPITIDGLPAEAPELKLARLLQDYRHLRETRLQDAPKSAQTAALLVLTSLQKRLLSSVEAFARTLRVHRAALERAAQAPATQAPATQTRATQAPATQTRATRERAAIASPRASSGWANGWTHYGLLREAPGADDDRAELPDAEIEREEDGQVTAATTLASATSDRDSARDAAADPAEVSEAEWTLLAEMGEIAEQARWQPDGRIAKLIDWIRTHQCPDLGAAGAEWLPRRVLIFTEYTDTKRYLETQLRQAIAASNPTGDRLDTFTGGMGDDRREMIKAAFNADPAHHPLRILIATDAAREGVNLQNHCADLFHFDVPWNPSRMEQRNGRIDRKLQRSPQVRCHYFYLPQRPEDRVIDVLVRKTATIQQELGSLSPVVEQNLTRLLDRGIRANDEQHLSTAIQQADRPPQDGHNWQAVIQMELDDATRQRQAALQLQVNTLEDQLRGAQQWLKLDADQFRDALSAALELLGAEPLQAVDPVAAVQDRDRAQWQVPALHERSGADPGWAHILDTLRPPRPEGQKLWEWRKETEIRPVVFKDPGSLDGQCVHLHLEHRLVQRLLGRFVAQGFVYDELTRACVCRTDDPVPKVVILGRLSLYGDRAARLHDEIVAVAAEWIDPAARGRSKLRPLTETEKEQTLQALGHALATPRLREVDPQLKRRFQAHAPQDVQELLKHLERRAATLTERAERDLHKRGEQEAEAMRSLLETQRDRIAAQEQTHRQGYQMEMFKPEELRQVEADRRHWRIRLAQLAQEMETEPARIREIYQIRASRIEPVGLVYLWPVSS
jgi:hypothetical protein